MKKLLALCFLVVAAAASSSASTITVGCSTSGGGGVSGTSDSVCNIAAPPVDFSSLDSIVFTFKFDADFGLGSGSVLESFDVLPMGPGDAFGAQFDHPTGQIVTDTARGIVGTFTILNPTIHEVDAALGDMALSGILIQDTWSSGSGSFFNAAFDYQIDVNYTPDPSTGTTPEPGTFTLLGTGLIGIAAGVLRRLRWKGFGSSLIPGFAVVAALLLGASGARADQILVNQPAESPLQDLGGVFAINLFNAPFETFSLSQSSTIDSIEWQGSYATNNFAVPGTADATQFVVNLYHCSTGDCNAESFPVFAATEAFTPAQAHETFVGVADPLFLGEPIAVSVYNYQVNYTTPFTVDAGTYALVLETTIPDETTAWFWDGGTGGDGVSYTPLGGVNQQQNFDLAFSILGTATPAPTPEPSSLMLFGTGLVGVAAIARRRLVRS